MSALLVKLKDLCSLITKGTTPTSIGLDFADDGVGFLRVQNVSGGSVNFQNGTLFIAENVHQELRRSQILAGDILLSIAGTIGRIGVVPENAPALNCNQALAIIRPEARVFRPFLRHWLESADAQFQMRGATVTGTIQNLSLAQVGRLELSLPLLPEQRRIAAILDQADALRAKRREALAQLDSLTQSIFIEMFGDPVTNSKALPTKKLSEITTFENGDRSGNYPSGDDIKIAGILFLSTKNITNDRLDLTKRVYISKEKFDSLSRGKVLRNDLIITLRGTLGSCCIFDAIEETAFINAQMMIIRPQSGCSSEYLHALLTSQQAQERFDHIGRGAAVPQLTSAQLASLPIPVPSEEKQREFAVRKRTLDELKAKEEQGMAELDTLFASLQHRAFSGEL
ncbi:Type I restriction-modification system, specificity subunit S [Oxalobacteraceae bacterium IMCC9480]|nr:Type I restriction-modification system, specificity subunit S [Oxalobacteraceae bacterium IMCC9480]NDP59510.1 restriction endonuclease subunit S [Oxalobacteraceae bacterium]